MSWANLCWATGGPLLENSRNIMKNYPNTFKKIKLSLNNIHELVTNYGVEILNKEVLKFINLLINEIIAQKNIASSEEFQKYLFTI